MERRTSFNGISSARTTIDGLEVSAPVLGRCHEFKHDGTTFRVSIPAVSEFAVDGLHPVGRSAEHISLSSWYSDNPDPETTMYAVGELFVEADVVTRLSAPFGLFEVRNNAYELVGDSEAKRNSALVADYDLKMVDALEHWKSVCRWVTGSSALGARSHLNVTPHLDFSRILRSRDRKTFWASGGHVASLRRTEIDSAGWDQCEAVLQAAMKPPIWIGFLDDVHHRWVGRDFVGVLLSSAIACETVARQVFWVVTGGVATESARDLIDRVAIQGILTAWPKLTGLPKTGAVHEIFNKRNKLVHLGGNTSVSAHTAETVAKDAREFVLNADEWLSASASAPNPRLWRSSGEGTK